MLPFSHFLPPFLRSGLLTVCFYLILFLQIQLSKQSTQLVSPLKQHVHLQTLLEKLNNTILDPIVDADLPQLSKVFYHGNLCPFKRKILDKMANGENVKILIVGGSVTYGADLKDRLKQRWSYSFTELLNSGWYSGKFDVVNVGVGACNVDTWIYRTKEKDFQSADLIIVDLSVNDQGFDLQVLPHLYETFIQLLDALPQHPAIYFNQAFRGAKLDKNDINKHCPTDYISCCPGSGELFCHRWWEMQDFVSIPLKKFGIPFVSYRDLVWPDYFHPPDQLNQFWNGMSHPDYKAHALFAKLFAYGFYRQLKESHHYHLANDCDAKERETYSTQENRNSAVQPICKNDFITNMQAGDSPASKANFQVLSNEEKQQQEKVIAMTFSPFWRYYNDSQLKFGWILDTAKEEVIKLCPQGEANTFQSNNRDKIDSFVCDKAIATHSLSLPVEFQEENPKLQITFLISYAEEMGDILLWLDNNSQETVKLTGKWSMDYSVRHVATISKEPLVNVSSYMKGDSYLLSSLSPGRHVLHLSVAHWNHKEKFKWKLLGVSTC
jgi:hypothetical protein